MIENNMKEENDVSIFLRHYYKNRGLIFRVLILMIVLSVAYSVVSALLFPPIYRYTSQSLIDISIGEDSEYQKPIFVSYLSGQQVFEESAKSIGLDAGYALWRGSINVENIKDTSQYLFKISANTSDKLVELNRRMVSNAIYQTSSVLEGINVQILDEAEILNDVQEVRSNVDYVSNLLFFVTLGALSIFGYLTFQVFLDRKIKNAKDIEFFMNLEVIGAIPDFQRLVVSEEINLSNFLRGLIWQKKK